ncbi:hypothetical protein RISK_000435 [Rhodopirellula islandica]|uniref:DoxX family protein n=1 Tax=Rhodopirellula islandica TaxID=595434 RepID=A0A0J1BLG4_RHOIS|nr:membrane protein [Rhodopirellula islandica]KLU07357.1 hypothetical protein RISK_000435 [Rhodopirellula islandica]
MVLSSLRRLLFVGRLVCLWLVAALFILAGINHFVSPAFYVQMIPDGWPSPRLLVFVSGFFEVLGGTGLLFRRLRTIAGFGLIALLIAVFPANVHMAMHADRYDAFSQTGLIARLPLQAVLIALVWWVACSKRNREVE